ncbi:MAG: SUF system NifU family Fe-S cluster assembly protein [Acholeplasmatales bacterium]|jgi:nitrogen fixation NifU-like protein|nr:SUF system NifU family Fe-S cluster assembly protein [Acholeplasmatales bacterium]
MDLKSLYRAVIMDNYKNPKNKGITKDDKYHFVHLNNPSCGDNMNVEVLVENGIIKDIHQDAIGCSISCSSASVMSETLKGKTIEEARKIIADFYILVEGQEPQDEEALGEAIAYGGVKDFPARIKCATLSWKAIEKALDELES